MLLESSSLPNQPSLNGQNMSYSSSIILEAEDDHHHGRHQTNHNHHHHENGDTIIRSNRLVAAIDQGTSSSRFLVFSTETGELVTYHQIEIKKIYPNEGWVEQDPAEILSSVTRCIDVVAKKLPELGFQISDIRCVGVTNQRESTILWERTTGKALYNSIVWLDNRTSDLVETVIDRVPGRDMNWLKSKTGLPISTYFSALKIKWLIKNVAEVRRSMLAGTLMFGTIDSWLLWNLTGKHLTDVTNASRTLLMDLETLEWDAWLCDFFKIPISILPEIKPSSSMFGEIQNGPLRSIPITGVIGDQNAALVGQKCLSIGQIKVTYGTGAFLMQNIGPGPLHGAYKNVPEEARHKLLTTVAFKLGDEMAWYALEGSIAIAGAAITWLRDNLELIDNYGQVEDLARMDSNSGGLYFVPAFQGLYAPYWDAYASGLIIGISQFTRKSHLVRATLEGVAYQTNDILCLMRNGLNYGIRVDGGMSSNDLLCQILSNVTGNLILRAKMAESTAFGAALVASHHCGLWERLLKADHNHQQLQINDDILATNFNNNNQSAMNNGKICNGNISNKLQPQQDSTFDHIKRQLSSFLSSSSSSSSSTTTTTTTSLSPSSTLSSSSTSQPPKSTAQLLCEPINETMKLQYDLFRPELDEDQRQERIENWRAAVRRSRKWIRINEQKEQKRVEYLRLSTLPMTFFIISTLGLCILSRRF
ncbi:glycerol kinase 3-like protein [Dermatophagoides farinae]|uniref:Probable glycerol kinase n=1 Tax=Dermatophagoides farinae TaxID=6954 RepID=A0A9D4SM58_DERFA|nr:glycerol kinase-like isoform X1 [Dermatophagoides farinae]KAH7646837.1 glycerol kinase 3-like protein [Dermatophagoides farinae]